MRIGWYGFLRREWHWLLVWVLLMPATSGCWSGSVGLPQTQRQTPEDVLRGALRTLHEANAQSGNLYQRRPAIEHVSEPDRERKAGLAVVGAGPESSSGVDSRLASAEYQTCQRRRRAVHPGIPASHPRAVSVRRRGCSVFEPGVSVSRCPGRIAGRCWPSPTRTRSRTATLAATPRRACVCLVHAACAISASANRHGHLARP
jgi:hypothetical protein